MTQQYTSKGGKTLYKPSLEQCEAMSEESEAWCLACGSEVSNMEPDTNRAQCPHCGEFKVYGPDELVCMNLVH
jgi:Zn finger protein HypA/HybF involved in hydrogenase expression